MRMKNPTKQSFFILLFILSLIVLHNVRYNSSNFIHNAGIITIFLGNVYEVGIETQAGTNFIDTSKSNTNLHRMKYETWTKCLPLT